MTVSYAAFDSSIEAKVVAFLDKHKDVQQFGQASDDAAWDGKTACTHTVWQAIIWMYTGHRYTINQINSMAGMPYKAKASNGAIRGMNNNELQHLIDHLHLPYKIVWGQSWLYLIQKAMLGPVMYGMRYGSAPEWKGYHYNGVTASSPFAIQNGKTQLTGFENGRHAVLLAGRRKRTYNGVATQVIYRKEPNHGSGTRPEKPPYDVITSAQGSKEYNDFHDRLGGTLYAAVPTRSFTIHGL